MSAYDKWFLFYGAWRRALHNAGVAGTRFATMDAVMKYLRDHPSAVTRAALSYRAACDTIGWQVWEGRR